MVLRVGSEAEARRLIVKLGLDPDEYLKKMKEVKDATEKAKDEIEEFGEESEESTEKAGEGAKKASKDVDTLTTSLKKLLTAAAVFGAVRAVVRFFQEAAASGLAFTQSLFTLEVAIRGLQRVGLDTTIAGWHKRLAALKAEFPIFSKKDFVDAASLAALMTREFGFTEKQIANVVRQSAILAQITGKDLAEAVRGITYAIGSGYFTSLQRAGINISRQIIAEEAMRRGYEGSYEALNQNIRAMIAYEIVQNNLNAISEDASRIIETTTGQVRRLNASYEDFMMTLGLIITDTEEAKDAVGGLASVLEFASDVLEVLNSFWASEDVSFLPVPLLEPLQRALAAVKETREEWNKMEGIVGQIRQYLIDMGFLGPPEEILGDVVSFGGLEVFNQDRYDELEEALNKAIERTLDIEAEGEEKRLDIKERYWKDLADKYDKHLQKMVDIKTDYDQKLADIDLKESRAIADAQIDYAYRVAEAARQAAFRREEAERRYREREIQAEKRFQEKMRQLRENFLLNLEDAVRERDALQIIRLIRQYNLRKTQMERENKLSGEDRSDAFQEQLRQIEQQRLERQRQLAIEHQRRLEDIAVQAERERAKAALDFERRQTDEKARAKAESEARTEKFKEDMLDLDEQIQERINKMLAGLQKEYGLSKIELEAISDLYYDIYVKADSKFNKAIDYAIERLLQLNAIHQRVMAMLGQPQPGELTPGEIHGAQHAEGGIVIANKPTTVTFGEAGIEAGVFTPLSRAGVNTGRITGNLPAGLGGRMGGGKHTVGISLSPGLEGKIIDQTLDEASDIIFKIERARL